ncbi:hypothetical protein [Cupriavidus necator]
MSYLNPLRLHFAGQFQANVSTVNNDPGHFDNAAFEPSYQKLQGPNMNPPNGWFNPTGDASWRLLGCKVTSAWLPSGAASPADPVVQYLVADSDGRVCGKMVDLDSEQQLVSEIWGLQVRITDSKGNTLLRGNFDPAPFLDIWDRATGQTSGDVIAGAMYQSVLTSLQWADVSNSPFLAALQASGDRLSIKFNVDGINLDYTSPQFMCGRIAGTIGPSAPGEPKSMVIGRQFMTAAAQGGNFFKPKGGINFFAAQVDSASSSIFLDLGNALSTGIPGGALNDLGDLTLSVATSGGTLTLGTIPSAGQNGYSGNTPWYQTTAGVVQLPLTAQQLAAVKSAPLTLSGNSGITISEWASGVFVRADTFVCRASPGDKLQVPVYAMQWGQPMVEATLSVVPDSSQLQPSNMIHPHDVPPVATPLSALSFVDNTQRPQKVTPLSDEFNGTLVTGQNGVAMLSLVTSDPGTPRYFNHGKEYGLDGQVYGIRIGFSDTGTYSGPENQWNFISILLWSDFSPAQPVTWTSVQPIFQQYANLYPVMARFLDMADYKQVVANASLLSLAFGLDPSDPNSMPVTRDLSPAKRAAIQSFLANPQYGTGAPPPVARAQAAAPASDAMRPAAQGGKAAASARRLVLRGISRTL